MHWKYYKQTFFAVKTTLLFRPFLGAVEAQI